MRRSVRSRTLAAFATCVLAAGSLATVSALVTAAPARALDLAGTPPALAGLAGVHDLDITGDRVRCQVDSDALAEVLRLLTTAGVRSLVSQPPTLEELFLMHYGPEEARS